MKFRKIPSLKYLYEIDQNGTLRNVKSKKVLKPEIDKDGYRRYAFHNKNLDKHTFEHRLVGEVWLTNKPENWESLTINHIDANKQNNNYKNLEFITRKANSLESAIRNNSAKNVTSYSYEAKKCKATAIDGSETITFDSTWIGAKFIQNLFPDKSIRSISKSISRVCRGERKVAYKYKWEYI